MRKQNEAVYFGNSVNSRYCSSPRKCRENDLSWISDLEARLFEKAESNSITNGLKNFRAETLMRKNVNNSHQNEQRQNVSINNRDKVTTKQQHQLKIIHSLRKMDDTNLNLSAAIFENFSHNQNGEKSSFPSENGHFRQLNPKNFQKNEEDPIYIPRPDYDIDYSSYIYGHVIKPKVKSEDDISMTAANRHMTLKRYSDYEQGARIYGSQHPQNNDHNGKRNVQQKTLVRNSYDDISARKIAGQNVFLEDTTRKNGIFSDDSRMNGIPNEFGRRNGIFDDSSPRNGISNGHGRRNGTLNDCCQKNEIFVDGGMRHNIFNDDIRRNGMQNGGYLDNRQNGDLRNMNNRYVW
uniref:Uncharacterized protein n=1 Tax=Romanomermis culicivorax TaxID=13658 RepID=A0A915I4I0_ROMCU